MRAITLAAATGVAAALAASGVAQARVVDSASASGDYAIAMASGNVNNPGTIRVRVRSSPHQRVSVSWSMVCSRGSGAGSKSGQFSGRTTITRKLRKPMRNPDNCSVAASAQLDGSGRVKVQILG